LFHQP